MPFEVTPFCFFEVFFHSGAGTSFVTSGGNKRFEGPANIHPDQVIDQGARLARSRFP